MTQVNEVATQSRLQRAGGWFRMRWAVTLLVAVGLLAPTSWALIHNQETSPLDEWVFVDYTSKVFSQGFVRRGEVVGMFTAELMACHGVIPGGTFGTCGSGDAILAKLPYGGQNGAADYTPLYFWVTAVVGGGIQLITGLDALTSWRMTGGIWLAAAMLVIYLLFRRLKVGDTTTLAIGLVIIGSPFAFWANSFVSTDAPSLLVGATLMLLAYRIRRQEIAAWWLLIAAPIAMALKVTNLVAIGFVAIYLVGSWGVAIIRSRRELNSIRLPIVTGLVIPPIMLLVSAAVPILWSRFLSLTAVPSVSADQGISVPLTWQELGLQATNFVGQSLSYGALAGVPFNFVWTPIGWLTVTGVFGAIFVLRKWGDRSEFATATAIAGIVMAPVLAIALWVTTHSYFQLSPRYGASLIPAFTLSLAFLVRNAWARGVIGGYGALLVLSGFVIAVNLNSVVLS